MSFYYKISKNRAFCKGLTTQLNGTQLQKEQSAGAKRNDKSLKLFVGNNLGSTNENNDEFNKIEVLNALSDTKTSELFHKTLTLDQQYAYVAGLIDGDGSIFCLLAERKDYRFGYEIRPCMNITQRPEKQQVLLHANTFFGEVGTLRRRKDNISSLDFAGRDKVSRVLPLIKPYLYLKRKQARIILHVIEQMPYVKTDPQKFLNLCRIVDLISQANDGNNLKNTSENVREFLLKKGFQVV